MSTMEEIINRRIDSLEGLFNWDLYVRTKDLVLINYPSKDPLRYQFLDRLNQVRLKAYEEKTKL